MILRGIDFGKALCASGARNFFGEGWWYHRFFHWMGLSYQGSTLVAKTTTLEARQGNMLVEGTKPMLLFPSCVKVAFWKGIVLNAVGLSGPGARWLFQKGIWYERKEPFFLSFMSVENTLKGRAIETQRFMDLLGSFMPFKAPIGLQMNFSCPNVGIDPASLTDEMGKALDIAKALNIPVVPKINATFPLEPIIALQDHEAFDALSVSNTIPWGKLPEEIPWSKLWGSETSPLAEFGGGGLSGKPLLPIVTRYIENLRECGFRKPIIGGGGILSKGDADKMLDAGADAVELGSVSILRPWRVQRIIDHVNRRGTNGSRGHVKKEPS